jgi:cysteine desulfurase NifS
MKPIYLDYNATTPIDPEVAAAMQPYLVEYFGNPSSAHWYGQQTKKAVETARQQVAALLQCHPHEVIFTSGGSEANNHAIKGVAFAHRERGTHIITTTIEHPAVTEVCRYLETQGFQVTYVPVDGDGMVDMSTLQAAIRPETILITVMHANNEVGTIQPIAEITRLAKPRGILVHTDAAQSVGKIATPVETLGVDLLSIAGHKLYAPKGIGALYSRHGTRLEKLIHGADHERQYRAGTENVLEIVGLGKACEVARHHLAANMAHMQAMRDRLAAGLQQQVPGIKINGHPEHRLPNTLSVSFPQLEANQLLAAMTDVAASSGAACHSDTIEVSAVLAAMQVPLDYAMGTIRFSTGRMTTADEIDRALAIVVAAVRSLIPAASAARS